MVNLGDSVKDEVSGFKGIVVAKHEYLQGCTRISVQPPVKKDGSMVEAQTFDEPQLQIIKSKAIKRKSASYDPGGPEKYIPQAKTTGNR